MLEDSPKAAEAAAAAAMPPATEQPPPMMAAMQKRLESERKSRVEAERSNAPPQLKSFLGAEAVKGAAERATLESTLKIASRQNDPKVTEKAGNRPPQ